METVETLSRAALRDIAQSLDAASARWLVDYYYAVQDYRIQAAGQARAVTQEADDAPSLLVSELSQRMHDTETLIRYGLHKYAESSTPGQWALSITGIGPVIAAGLLAHIDIEKAPTVGHIWRFAGLDPTVRWGKGEKRPWNASLKVLCWKIGDSFVKNKGRESDVYGKVYAARKDQEIERNDAGAFADQAARSLEERTIRDKDLRATYEAGKLPAGRLDLRARRYAVKLFLSHFHHVAYVCANEGELPPKPYVLSHGNHAHFIGPPNWPMA